ncbi:MAG: cupin domain-containing protein [Chitinophagaceae bacterium]
MTNISAFIDSGILETYVLGMATVDEIAEIEDLAAQHIEIRNEIEQISIAIEHYALANAVAPNPTIKTFLLATLDFTMRMEAGEAPSFPPELHEAATIADYEPWINRVDMVPSSDFKDAYAKIIGYTPVMITAIVWIHEMAPQEVHDDEYEKFLILEGSCNITIGDKVHQLVAGNYMAIPLHAHHSLQVTSSCPCKAILQRVAA